MRRPELQGLRGWAIILVLGFHLQPSIFRLGFIGVDVFFVLSGFFMAQILSTRVLTKPVISSFYIKRFVRIFPSLYFVVFLTFVVSWRFLISSDQDTLQDDSIWVFTFLTNIHEEFGEKGYWDQISAYRFFLHTWSLGVEIQFYLIAPLLFYLLSHFSFFNRALAQLAILIISITYQMLTNEKSGYYSLISRIWQFMCGTLAFTYTHYRSMSYLSLDNESTDSLLPEKEANNKHRNRTAYHCSWSLFAEFTTCLVLFFAIWSPAWISETSMRIISTVLAGGIVALSSDKTWILTDHIITYVGDISYMLYLVHWPVIILGKFILDTNQLGGHESVVICLIVIVATVILHNIVETPLMTQNLVKNSIFCAICLVATILFPMIYSFGSEQIIAPTISTAADLKEGALIWNDQEVKRRNYTLPCDADPEVIEWTKYKTDIKDYFCQTKGNGTSKVLILGNSMAHRAFPLLYRLLNKRYGQLRLFARGYCSPLGGNCPKYANASRVVVENFRPDVIFYVYLVPDIQFVKPVEDFKTDPVYLNFQENIDFYSARSKINIIDMPLSKYSVNPPYELMKRLKTGAPLETLRISRKDDQVQQQHHRERLLHLKCKNCVLHNVTEALYDKEGFYYFYNRKNLHSYMTDSTHFSIEGLKLVEPTYKNIIDKYLSKFL